MPRYHVRCAYDASYWNACIVEADNPAEAAEKGAAWTSADGSWDGYDDVGPTYVEAITEIGDAEPAIAFDENGGAPANFEPSRENGATMSLAGEHPIPVSWAGLDMQAAALADTLAALVKAMDGPDALVTATALAKARDLLKAMEG